MILHRIKKPRQALSMPGEATTDTMEVSMANHSLTTPSDFHNPITVCSDCKRAISGTLYLGPFGWLYCVPCYDAMVRRFDERRRDYEDARRRPIDL